MYRHIQAYTLYYLTGADYINLAFADLDGHFLKAASNARRDADVHKFYSRERPEIRDPLDHLDRSGTIGL